MICEDKCIFLYICSTHKLYLDFYKRTPRIDTFPMYILINPRRSVVEAVHLQGGKREDALSALRFALRWFYT